MCVHACIMYGSLTETPKGLLGGVGSGWALPHHHLHVVHAMQVLVLVLRHRLPQVRVCTCVWEGGCEGGTSEDWFGSYYEARGQ